MSDTLNFRTAFNGFHREDVVHYIAYLNAQHESEITQLRAELENAHRFSAAEELNEASQTIRELERKLAEQAETIAQLRAQSLHKPESAEAQPQPQRDIQLEELEAYRRAERTERVAKERAEKIYRQADCALTCATAKVDEAFTQIGELTSQVTRQLDNLQTAVTGSKQALADAVATLGQLRAGEE